MSAFHAKSNFLSFTVLIGGAADLYSLMNETCWRGCILLMQSSALRRIWLLYFICLDVQFSGTARAELWTLNPRCKWMQFVRLFICLLQFSAPARCKSPFKLLTRNCRSVVHDNARWHATCPSKHVTSNKTDKAYQYMNYITFVLSMGDIQYYQHNNSWHTGQVLSALAAVRSWSE